MRNFKMTLSDFVFTNSGQYVIGRAFILEGSGSKAGYYVWCLANNTEETFIHLNR